jgi:hypothetical protein
VKIASLGDIEYDTTSTGRYTPVHVPVTHTRRYSTPIPKSKRIGVTYTAHHPSDCITPSNPYQTESHSRKTREVIDRLDARNELLNQSSTAFQTIQARYEKIDDNVNKLKLLHIAVLCTLTTIIAVFIAYQAIKGHYSG